MLLYTRRMPVEIRHFRALVAAADNATLTVAADVLQVSQPTLTRTLQQLEQVLGRQLLFRSPHGVALTLEGEHAVIVAREVLEKVDAFTKSSSYRTPLQIGFAWLLPPRWYSDLRTRLERLGYTTTPVRVDDPVACLADLNRGPLDLAIFRNTHRTLPSGVDSVVLGTEKRLAVFPAESQLAQAYLSGDVPQWEDLRTEPLVTNPKSGTTHPGSWSHPLPPHEDDRKIIECSNFDEWIELVASGAGIGAVPEAARYRAPHPGVVYADLPNVPPNRISLAWRSSETTRLRAVLDVIPSLAPTAPAQ